MIAIPVSSVIGSPLSALLLSLDGALGLAGWQWLFIIEGVPAEALGALALFVLEDGPADAKWLDPDERAWLSRELRPDTGTAFSHEPVWRTLSNGKLWALALIYCGSSATSNALSLWQPQIIKSFGLTIWETALLNMVPFAVAAGFMVLWGKRADRTGERKFATALPLALTSFALLATLVAGQLWIVMILLTLVLLGNYAIKGPFWALSAETLPPAAAAAGFAAINAVAHVGTAAANSIIGILHDQTKSFPVALLPLAALTAIGAAATLCLGRSQSVNR